MPIDNIPVPPKPGMDQQGQAPILTPPAPLKKAKGRTPEKLNTAGRDSKDIIDIRPTYKEEVSKTAVFTFGRMNPPTAGHEKLILKVADVAKQYGTKGHIVVSHSHDDSKNPLPQDVKIKYLSRILASVHVHGSSKSAPSFLHQAKEFYKQGNKNLVMVAGSDRVAEYQKILDKYNGHPDQFTFDSIKVVSAGQRDPDAEGTTGISGTKMREFAKNNDIAAFKKGLPKALQNKASEIAGYIKEEMELFDLIEELDELEVEAAIELELLTEDSINERVMNLMQRRKAGMKMKRLKFRIQRAKKIKSKRMATMDALQRRSRRAARTIIRKRLGGDKGAHYADLSPSEKIQLDRRVDKKQAIIGRLAMRLMPKVRASEIVRLRNARSKKNEQYINTGFESYIGEVRSSQQTSGDVHRVGQEYSNIAAVAEADTTSPKIKALRDLHSREREDMTRKHALDKEKMVVQVSRQKQSQIRKEHHEIAEAVDTMIDALIALEAKADRARVDLDTLMIEFVDGYNNPHGKQTPQQGGFAAVNKILAEMSQDEQGKAETIVKGMKNKLSSFKQKYGKDAESVMYATANKLAQEDIKTFRKELNEKGLWDNIRAKRNRGEKMNPKGHPDAPTAKEINKSQIKEADDNTSKTTKMNQLFRMGLANKGELQTMMRAVKGGEDSLKNPALRTQLYSLLTKLVDIVTTDGQIFVKVRQSVQKNREDLQAVEEILSIDAASNILKINEAFQTINISESKSSTIKITNLYMNKDGSQKVMPTVFDKSGNTPRHPATAYRNVETAKAEVQRWMDDHKVVTEEGRGLK
jgi:predicted nucleotidyltransferase